MKSLVTLNKNKFYKRTIIKIETFPKYITAAAVDARLVGCSNYQK